MDNKFRTTCNTEIELDDKTSEIVHDLFASLTTALLKTVTKHKITAASDLNQYRNIIFQTIANFSAEQLIQMNLFATYFPLTQETYDLACSPIEEQGKSMINEIEWHEKAFMEAYQMSWRNNLANSMTKIVSDVLKEGSENALKSNS